MFCTNCGSKLPDGSNFCSVCGARLKVEAPETFNNKQTTANQEMKNTSVSFDWSNVKEESHRKVTSKVHSPWGTTELSKGDFFDSDDYAPNEEYSRTMSFIDLLKKERDERAKAAEEEARQFTEKKEEPYDYSAFQEAPPYYVPPLYDLGEEEPESIQEVVPRYGKHSRIEDEDVETDDIALDEEDYEEDSFDIFDTSDIPTMPKDSFSNATEVTEVAETIEAAENKELSKAEPQKELETAPMEDDMDYAEAIEALNTVGKVDEGKETKIAEEIEDTYISNITDFYDSTTEETLVDDDIFFGENITVAASDEKVRSLDSEIADILAVGSGKSEEDKDIDLYSSLDEEVQRESESSIGIEPELSTELEIQNGIESEILLEQEKLSIFEPILEEDEEDDKNAEIPLVEIIQEDELSETEEAPVGEVFSEDKIIEETTEETEDNSMAVDLNSFFEPEIIEETSEVQEPLHDEDDVVENVEMEDLKQRLTNLIGYSPSSDEVAEATEELIVQEIIEEDADEELILKLELDDDETDDNSVEESDALSVDEIERELFGETTDEDIEAEATKKIDKFYTLYKKNEEFQKLLDEEYNKLKIEDSVPHVDDLIAGVSAPQVEQFEKEEQKEDKDIEASPIVKVEEPKKEAVPVSDDEKKTSTKFSINKEKFKTGETNVAASGNKLTIVAVVLAAILVIMLAMIFIVYCAPYSALGLKINSILQTIASCFSSVDSIGTQLLL